MWPKNMVAGKMIECFLCICSLTFALPMSIALFEQRAMLTRHQIDPEFQKLAPKEEDEENKG